jgi:hypothetical protein
VLLQNLAAVAGFQTGKAVPWRLSLILAIPMAAGTALGSLVALRIPEGAMRVALALSVLFVALSALLPPPQSPRLRSPYREACFFGIGFYTGFLQAGVGFILLAVLVGGVGLDLVRANGCKVFVVLVSMVPSLALFARGGNVVWGHGLVLACGNGAGAWIASRLAVKRGSGFIRFVVAVAAILACVKLLLFPAGPRR